MDPEEKPALKDAAPDLVVGRADLDAEADFADDEAIDPQRSMLGFETFDGDATKLLGETDSVDGHTSKKAHTRRRLIKNDEMVTDVLRIKSKLGKGGMGDVYLAHHILTKKDLAVKFLAPNQSMQEQRWLRFQQEARVLSGLNHPGIIRVMDFGLAEEYGPYIVMEYFDGEPLDSLIARKKNLNPDFAAEVCRQVAEALEHAHALGIIHRDIKPSNVLVKQNGDAPPVVRIVDFGIAKANLLDNDELSLTQTGQLLGSPLYMSPEQCVGNKCDARSDIYSLGCVLYEAITGHAPLVGKTYADTIIKHQREKPAPIPNALNVSPDMQKIVTCALEKQASDRFRSMTELKNALAGYLKGRGVYVRRSARSSLKLVAYTLLILTLSVICLIKMTIASEPLKSAQLIASMELPDPITSFLMPDATVAEAVRSIKTAEKLYAGKKYAEAEKLLKGVAEANPKYVNLTIFPLARSLAMQGKYAEAQSILRQMAGGNDLGAARNIHVIGYILSMENHWPNAMPFFRTARDLYVKVQGPESTEATKDMANIGIGATRAGDMGEARENYQRAFNILGKHRDAYANVYEEARRWLQENKSE